MDPIDRAAVLDALDEQIKQCDRALNSFNISMKDEYAVKVERASLVAFRETLKYMPSVQPEPHWIPVTERLPEPRIDVWVNSDIGQIQGYYEENAETWYASFGQGRDYLELIVNAWMPLPDPYQEEGDSE